MQRYLIHYWRALLRKWSRLRFGKDEELLKWPKNMVALPLLPESEIDPGFHALAPTVDIKAKYKGIEVIWFCIYLEKYWIQ